MSAFIPTEHCVHRYVIRPRYARTASIPPTHHVFILIENNRIIYEQKQVKL